MLKITAIGNLTNDVELKMNETTGKPYAILRIASDRRYKDKDGNKLTDFISIKVLWPSAAPSLPGRAASWRRSVISRLSPLRMSRSVSPVSSSRPAMWSSSRPARRRKRRRNWKMSLSARSLPDEKYRDHIYQR